MEAVILAGGLGTRLQPLTFTRPKALLPLLNRPMIDHILDKLRGFTVVLAVGYGKERLAEHFREREDVVLVAEKEPLGTGGALRNVEKYLTGAFLVFNGDVITSLPVQDFVDFHKRTGSLGTIALYEVEDPQRYGAVELDNDKKITRFVEKPKEPFSQLINAGTYLLELDVLDYIARGREVSIEREVFPKLCGQLYGYAFEGYWLDIGKAEDYINAHVLLMQRRGLRSLIGEGAKVHGTLDYVAAGAGAEIGKSTLSRTVLFDNAKVGDRCELSWCVLGEGASVGDNVTLRNVLLADSCEVCEGSFFENDKICE